MAHDNVFMISDLNVFESFIEKLRMLSSQDQRLRAFIHAGVFVCRSPGVSFVAAGSLTLSKQVGWFSTKLELFYLSAQVSSKRFNTVEYFRCFLDGSMRFLLLWRSRGVEPRSFRRIFWTHKAFRAMWCSWSNWLVQRLLHGLLQGLVRNQSSNRLRSNWFLYTLFD